MELLIHHPSNRNNLPSRAFAKTNIRRSSIREQGGDSMNKKLMMSAAVGVLIVSGALAQSPNSPPSSSSPAAQPRAATQTPSAGKADFVISQKPDQWLASKFKGTSIMSSDNQKIGSVSDILFDKTGKIEAYVVSVGGLLGVGAKEVALTPSSFSVIPGGDGKADVLKLSLNMDELKQAQNFTRYEPPRPATTGSGSGGLGGLPARPSTNLPPSGR
jgi:sporulation protein YlmC with PRC-barrel domain